MSPSNSLGGVRAVICDVYGTLLKVGPPPPDAALLWKAGCEELTGEWMTLEECSARSAAMVAEENAQRRLQGEPFPDANWLEVLDRLFFGRRDVENREFKARGLSDLQARCVRTCTAMTGSIAALQALHSRRVLPGLASNAQHYTRGEMEQAGLALKWFEPELCFLSGEQGFAKPSPRVFAQLTERLAARGIAPHETLMIGDSMEKDILPAAAAGWRTWHIGPRTWEELNVEIRSLEAGGITKPG